MNNSFKTDEEIENILKNLEPMYGIYQSTEKRIFKTVVREYDIILYHIISRVTGKIYKSIMHGTLDDEIKVLKLINKRNEALKNLMKKEVWYPSVKRYNHEVKSIINSNSSNIIRVSNISGVSLKNTVRIYYDKTFEETRYSNSIEWEVTWRDKDKLGNSISYCEIFPINSDNMKESFIQAVDFRKNLELKLYNVTKISINMYDNYWNDIKDKMNIIKEDIERGNKLRELYRQSHIERTARINNISERNKSGIPGVSRVKQTVKGNTYIKWCASYSTRHDGVSSEKIASFSCTRKNTEFEAFKLAVEKRYYEELNYINSKKSNIDLSKIVDYFETACKNYGI